MMGHPTIRAAVLVMMFRSVPRFGMRISCASKEVQPFLSPLQTTSPNPFGTMVFPVDTTIPQRIQPSTAEGLLGFCLPFRCYDTATCGIEPGWSYLEHFGALTFRASCVGLNASDVECFLGGKLRSRRAARGGHDGKRQTRHRRAGKRRTNWQRNATGCCWGSWGLLQTCELEDNTSTCGSERPTEGSWQGT